MQLKYFIIAILIYTSCKKHESNTTSAFINENKTFIFIKNDSIILDHSTKFKIEESNFDVIATSDIFYCESDGLIYPFQLHININNDWIEFTSSDSCINGSKYFGSLYKSYSFKHIEWDSLSVIYTRRKDCSFTIVNGDYFENNSYLLSLNDEIALLFDPMLDFSIKRNLSFEVPDYILYNNGSIISKKSPLYIPFYLSKIGHLSYLNCKNN